MAGVTSTPPLNTQPQSHRSQVSIQHGVRAYTLGHKGQVVPDKVTSEPVLWEGVGCTAMRQRAAAELREYDRDPATRRL
jgi:hypothetical protein